MGWFTYKCDSHGVFKVSLSKKEKIILCKICNQKALHVPKVGTSVVYEKLDNGAMGRAVERIHNVEELMEERNDKSRSGETDE